MGGSGDDRQSNGRRADHRKSLDFGMQFTSRGCTPWRGPHLHTDRYWADEMAALQAAVLAGEMGDAAILCGE